MNLDEAFKISIENGWTTFKGHKIDSVRLLNSGDKRLAEVIEEHEGSSSSSTTFSYDEFFLDPLFWQSLGKGFRWEDELCSQCGKSPEKHIQEVAHVQALVLSHIGTLAGTALLMQ